MSYGKYPLLLGGILLSLYGAVMLTTSIYLITGQSAPDVWWKSAIIVALPALVLLGGVIGILFCNNYNRLPFLYLAKWAMIIPLVVNFVCTAFYPEIISQIFTTLSSWTGMDIIPMLGKNAYYKAAYIPIAFLWLYTFGIEIGDGGEEHAYIITKMVCYALAMFVYFPFLFSIGWVNHLVASNTANVPLPVFLSFYVIYAIVFFFVVLMCGDEAFPVAIGIHVATALIIPCFSLLWFASGVFIVVYALALYIYNFVADNVVLTIICVVFFGGSAPYIVRKYVNGILVSVTKHGDWSKIDKE